MISKIISYYRRNFWTCEKYARFIGVEVGDNCMISTKKFSSEPYLIKIGKGCRIAKGVSFFTHGGLWSQRQKLKENLDFFGKIQIGDYTYIGEDAKIMPGVSIGNNVIIGAGSIVTKSVPDGKICAGNPAKIVGETVDFVKRIRNYNVESKRKTYDEKRAFLLSLTDDRFIKK
ncbi:acyltransferase [Myroides odoratimimus]|uniref:acyltransferase n=1 Tax=Myroides odoratimimus TaxID=76832 RepID=UPI002575D094|nr:acyltransferase [Myroides odoratimimus]MDM1506887.1 acyltransferase [Myroides odoratimimus]MDM1537761.1 acyltransferase [Myroides odoratimimus]MDM1677314.1 acyltransferase [Myroides odoratimimus]MDM1680393.1 acyltransferase [Myroides odoratimimus]